MSTITLESNATSSLSSENGKEGGAFREEAFRVGTVNVLCRWRYVETPSKIAPYFRTLDLLLRSQPVKQDKNSPNVATNNDASGTAIDIAFRHLANSDTLTERALKIILAPNGGYLCMGNIFKLRVQPSELVEAVIPFASWDQYVPQPSLNANASLLDLIHSSPAAIVVKQSHNQSYTNLDLLQEELHYRLNFDWIIPNKPSPRTVAVVGARAMRERKRGIYWAQGYFETASALGVSMIVLDHPGHWLEGPDFAHLRQEFIAIDMSNLDELPSAMAKELQDKQLDGIVTFIDDYVIATAKAAELLGLPTESSQVMHDAHFKHKVRETITSNIPTAYLNNAQELLHTPAVPEKIASLEYPLIVKPTRGGDSRGVQKVNDLEGLLETVRTLERDGLADGGILLEPYIDGPELDANFAMLDGEVLFLEICDNFPCSADAKTAGLSDNFAETVLISHTALPVNEQEVIQSTLHAQLLQLGFRSGVFHVEARMKNSAMQYRHEKNDGILDLMPVDSSGQLDCFLIEVNARPPGAGGTWATYFTYGIDLGALQLLRALEDNERFNVLSKPFSFPAGSVGGGGGAQYWTAHCMIPIHRDNVYVPEDFFEQIYRRHPDIREHVCRAELYSYAGTVVSPRGGVGWIGYILLWSRTSRRHAVQMYNHVAKAAKNVLDGL